MFREREVEARVESLEAGGGLGVAGGLEAEEDLRAEGIPRDQEGHPSLVSQMNRICTEKGEDRLILTEGTSEEGEEGPEEVIMIEIMEKEEDSEEEAEGFAAEVEVVLIITKEEEEQMVKMGEEVDEAELEGDT